MYYVFVTARILVVSSKIIFVHIILIICYFLNIQIIFGAEGVLMTSKKY